MIRSFSDLSRENSHRGKSMLNCEIKKYLYISSRSENYCSCRCDYLLIKIVVALHLKFYNSSAIRHSETGQQSLDYRSVVYARSHTSRIRTYIYTHTAIPSKNDMASTKMRVSCSHWYCFAHLRSKDRLKALHIHTRSSFRFSF